MARILRLVFYTITAVALIYLANVLQNQLHQLFVGWGLTDTITIGGPLDQIADLPVFTNLYVDIAFLVIGVLGWLGIHYDQTHTYEGRGGAIRASFLSFFAAAFGILILLPAILVARNVDMFGQSGVPFAASFAAVIAWAVALALVALEWQRGRRFGGFDTWGQRCAKFFILLGQGLVLLMGVWAIGQVIQAIGQFIQSALQTQQPLELCSRQLDIFSQLVTQIARPLQSCTDIPPLGGALLTMALILAFFAAYVYYASRYKVALLSNIDAIYGAAVAGLVIILNGALGLRFLLDILNGHSEAVWAQSLLSTPGDTAIASYPVVGPFLAGLCVFGFYFIWEWRRQRNDRDDYGLQYGVMTLAILLGSILITGASLLLGHIVSTLLYNVGYVKLAVSENDWDWAVELLVPGLLVFLLRRPLRFMTPRSMHGSIKLAGRIYIWYFFIVPLIAASLCLFIAVLLLVFEYVLQRPSDNFYWPHWLLAAVVTGAVFSYYRGVKRERL